MQPRSGVSRGYDGRMEMSPRARSPLSRETRLLLITILASLTALWVLARLRFADKPLAADPLTPVLTQLAPPPVFDQLSSAVLQAGSRLAPVLMGIQLPPSTALLDARVTPSRP